MDLSPIFKSNIVDIYGKSGEAWLKALPHQVAHLCTKQGIRFVKPMSHLTYHFVAMVEVISSKEKAVLKMAPHHQNLIKEVNCLRGFHQGVPKVYWFDEEYHAYLMEQLVPGETLKSLMTEDDEATRVICQTIRDLQSKQHVCDSFKHLSELAKSLPSLKGKIDESMLSKSISLFADLTMDRTEDVLLHGDLHHDNILTSGTGFKAIDPHGYIGDPAFEIGPMIYNPGETFFNSHDLEKTIKRRLAILSDELPFDKKRMQSWTFCMTLLSIAWTVEDHGYVPSFELNVAQVIDKLI